MKKKLLNLGILALTFLVIALQAVSAYTPDGTELVFSANDGVYTKDYVYVDSYYGRPEYRIYVDDDYDYQYSDHVYGYAPSGSGYDYRPGHYFTNNYRHYDRDDIIRYYQRQRIANFIDRSAYSRYDYTYGLNSGEAFCSDCVDSDPAPTNWRNKYTYDPRLDSQGNYKDYYYKPVFDKRKDIITGDSKMLDPQYYSPQEHKLYGSSVGKDYEENHFIPLGVQNGRLSVRECNTGRMHDSLIEKVFPCYFDQKGVSGEARISLLDLDPQSLTYRHTLHDPVFVRTTRDEGIDRKMGHVIKWRDGPKVDLS